MSTKNGKRSRRKTDDEVVLEYFKAPLKKDRSMEKESVVVKPVETEECKGFEETVPKIQTVGNEEGEKARSSSPVKSANENEKNKDKTETPAEINDKKSDIKPDENDKSDTKPNQDDETKKLDDNDEEKVEGEKKEEEVLIETVQVETVTEVIISTNGVEESQDEEVEMEPLVIDNEEADPELQFDENSDGDSRKESLRESPSEFFDIQKESLRDSPLSRCRTRRSQTRNIPTPKTPKSIVEQNGDDKDVDDLVKSQDLPPCSLSTPEIPENDVQVSVPDNLEMADVDLNETRDSCESGVSTKVNVGSDLTREIDLSFPDKDSFINTAKELTVVETMRRLSSRRSIHTSSDYRKTLLKTNTERKNLTLPYSTARSSVEKLSGMKRKNRSETPDGVKRFKPEQSQTGLFSYISSPLQKIKSKFAQKEVSASTPKLTSYRKADLLDEAEFSKIQNEVNPHSEKKWCSIM